MRAATCAEPACRHPHGHNVGGRRKEPLQMGGHLRLRRIPKALRQHQQHRHGQSTPCKCRFRSSGSPGSTSSSSSSALKAAHRSASRRRRASSSPSPAAAWPNRRSWPQHLPTASHPTWRFLGIPRMQRTRWEDAKAFPDALPLNRYPRRRYEALQTPQLPLNRLSADGGAVDSGNAGQSQRQGFSARAGF